MDASTRCTAVCPPDLPFSYIVTLLHHSVTPQLSAVQWQQSAMAKLRATATERQGCAHLPFHSLGTFVGKMFISTFKWLLYCCRALYPFLTLPPTPQKPSCTPLNLKPVYYTTQLSHIVTNLWYLISRFYRLYPFTGPMWWYATSHTTPAGVWVSLAIGRQQKPRLWHQCFNTGLPEPNILPDWT